MEHSIRSLRFVLIFNMRLSCTVSTVQKTLRLLVQTLALMFSSVFLPNVIISGSNIAGCIARDKRVLEMRCVVIRQAAHNSANGQ